jgi:hypothetical protein
MMKKAVTAGFLAVLAACAGSGSQPLAPSADTPPALTAPPFPVGPYWISISGYDNPTPGLPACDKPAGEPPAGKHVTVQVTVVKEGGEWVGRVAEGPGDLELRFRDAGDLPFALRAFTGTLRGQAADTGIPGAARPTDVTIAIDGSAIADGQTAIPFSARVLSGRASGGIRFRDANGRSGACSGVSLTIVTDVSVFAEGAVFMDHLPSR